MKTLHTTLLAASFFLVTYVAAPTTAHAGGWFCAQAAADSTTVEKLVNGDTDIALAVARQGLPCRVEVEALQGSVASENFTYIGIPDQCVIQVLLTQELEDLHTRAANFLAHEIEVRQTQFQIVLARYERAVINIQEAWKNGEIAEDIALKAIYTMRVDAFDYLESLGVTSIRARLGEAMAELIARGTEAMDRAEALRDTFRKLYELRLEASLRVFEARLASGKLTKFDYKRVEESVRGLEYLHTQMKPYDCGP